ncbi:MAG TPA: ATP-binding protein [Deltaproteobacteria bacterium]|nr:ATP-binding protein [Deltaproteobacteria bacterium]
MKDHTENVRTVFEKAPFAVCAFDRSGTVVYINKVLESNMDPSTMPFVGKSLYELIHTFLVDDRLEKNLKRLIETNKPFNIVVETLSSPKVKASGFINITGYKVDSLYVLIGDFMSGGVARESRYRTLIEDAPDAILIMNHGFITFANQAFVDIMQVPITEILGRSLFDFVDEQGREALSPLRRKTARKFFTQVTVNTKTGQRVVEGSFQFIEDRPGTSLAMLRDVTEKVLLQKRLMRQNQDLAAINTISKTLSSSVDLVEVLQKTLEQVLQIMNIEMGFIHLLDERKNVLRCVVSHGITDDILESLREIRVGDGIAGRVAAGGKPIIIENASMDPRLHSITLRQKGLQSYASIPIQSRTRLMGVMNIGSFGQRRISPEDERLLITIGVHMGAVIENIELFQEVSRTTEELRDALDLIRQRNEELRQLVSTVSHDLKNPIVAINGFCERFMKTAANKLSPKELQYVEAIRESGRHMEEFVSNLLTLSAVENLKLKKEEFSTRDVLDDLLKDLSPLIDATQGRVIVERDLPTIKADRLRVTQVFTNLISNALKYAHPDRPPMVEVGHQLQGNQHIFSVKDNGIGIPEEHHRSIFDIFYRASDNHVEGTGIGLSIVKKALSVMGGDIWVKSQPGKGSTFYFTIPKE